MGSVTVPTLQVRTQTGDGTSLGHRECVRKAGFRAKGDRLRKHPNHRGLRPSTPRATCTRRAGRPKIPFRAARPPPPPPPPPHVVLGPYDPGTPRHPGIPRPQTPFPRRPRRPGQPAAPAREGSRCRSLRLPRSRRGRARGAVGGRGPGGRPRGTHASNLLFILSPPPSPLPHGVTSAPPGPSASGPATSGCAGRGGTSLRRPGGSAYPRTPAPGRCAAALGLGDPAACGPELCFCWVAAARPAQGSAS